MAVPPADWYADPFGRHERRFWDGNAWTDHVATGRWQGVDPALEDQSTPSNCGTQPRADWYPDPTSRHQRRYWDGTRWTDHVVSNGRQGVDPFAAAAFATDGSLGSPNQHGAGSPPWARVTRPWARATRDQPYDGALFTEAVLVIDQKARLFRTTVGYGISDQHGSPLGLVVEIDRDLPALASDALHGRKDGDRTYKLLVTDMTGRVLLTLTRPEVSPAGWHAVHVGGADGIEIGRIIQETVGLRGSVTNLAHRALNNVSEFAGLRSGMVVGLVVGRKVGQTAGKTVGTAVGWVAGKAGAWAGRTAADVTGVSSLARYAAGWLDLTSGHARFGLEADGQRLGSIHTENVEEWDFRVDDPERTEIARVTKKWAGWAKETFTNADHYVVQIHKPLDRPLLSLVVAAALAIDLSLKQGDPATDTPPSNRHT